MVLSNTCHQSQVVPTLALRLHGSLPQRDGFAGADSALVAMLAEMRKMNSTFNMVEITSKFQSQETEIIRLKEQHAFCSNVNNQATYNTETDNTLVSFDSDTEEGEIVCDVNRDMDSQDEGTENKPHSLILSGMPLGSHLDAKMKQAIWDDKYIDLATLLPHVESSSRYSNIVIDNEN